MNNGTNPGKPLLALASPQPGKFPHMRPAPEQKEDGWQVAKHQIFGVDGDG